MSERKIPLEDETRHNAAKQTIMQALGNALSPTSPTPRVPLLTPEDNGIGERMSEKPATLDIPVAAKGPAHPPPLSPKPPRSPRTSPPTNRLVAKGSTF